MLVIGRFKMLKTAERPLALLRYLGFAHASGHAAPGRVHPVLVVVTADEGSTKVVGRNGCGPRPHARVNDEVAGQRQRPEDVLCFTRSLLPRMTGLFASATPLKQIEGPRWVRLPARLPEDQDRAVRGGETACAHLVWMLSEGDDVLQKYSKSEPARRASMAWGRNMVGA